MFLVRMTFVISHGVRYFRKKYIKWVEHKWSMTFRGIIDLDYFDLYRKFTYTNQESYKELDHIVQLD